LFCVNPALARRQRISYSPANVSRFTWGKTWPRSSPSASLSSPFFCWTSSSSVAST